MLTRALVLSLYVNVCASQAHVQTLLLSPCTFTCLQPLYLCVRVQPYVRARMCVVLCVSPCIHVCHHVRAFVFATHLLVLDSVPVTAPCQNKRLRPGESDMWTICLCSLQTDRCVCVCACVQLHVCF